MPYVIILAAIIAAFVFIAIFARAAAVRSWRRAGKYLALCVGALALIPITILMSHQYFEDSDAAAEADRAACLVSAPCLVKTFEVEARTACESAVSKHAKLEAVWKSYSERYSTIAAYDTATSTIALFGHGVGFKNGFNATIPMRFACIYDAKADKILEVSVEKAN